MLNHSSISFSITPTLVLFLSIKQNDDYLHFLPGGAYEKWSPAEESPNRIDELEANETPADDPTNRATVEARRKLLAKRQRSLLYAQQIIIITEDPLLILKMKNWPVAKQ